MRRRLVLTVAALAALTTGCGVADTLDDSIERRPVGHVDGYDIDAGWAVYRDRICSELWASIDAGANPEELGRYMRDRMTDYGFTADQIARVADLIERDCT